MSAALQCTFLLLQKVVFMVAREPAIVASSAFSTVQNRLAFARLAIQNFFIAPLAFDTSVRFEWGSHQVGFPMHVQFCR